MNINVTTEDFVKEYMNIYKAGKSHKDLAEAIGLGQSAVSNRIKSLRNKGVKLPELKRKSNYKTLLSEDIKNLNTMIEKQL